MAQTHRIRPVLIAVLLSSAGLTHRVHSHETDNLYLPLDRPFADLGTYLDTTHARAIQKAVNGVNARIEGALRLRDPLERAARLKRLQDPDLIASEVSAQFSDAFTEVLDIEDAIRGTWARAAYPGQITAHWSVNWMYSYLHFPLDPRRVVLLFQSSTIKAHGVYFGTDKLSHFHHMGRYYYDEYRILQRKGYSDEEAVRLLVGTYSSESPISESGLLGFFATGVYSNADLASNYMGFKFLLNLTEPVMLKGHMQQPLVDRCGEFWSVNARVRPESKWFAAFISDHWNEALNPNLYGPLLRPGVKSMMERRADRIMAFYTQKDGRPAEASYYHELQVDLSTYHGENYGFAGRDGQIYTLGNTCIPALNQAAKEVKSAAAR